ncbi:type IV pilus biogenesis/stability protein PilW [Janthinobacterium agaricidamnosum]|uniref:Type IV pilus biogenesis/stability protein PilW n=1 Tax=Janthinobacterium agaricidamnosum NBRC 102515 = DSM 9628 TaxID=1349767 RepID=W0V9Q5_9BURK|nr:type IV pilus biogenesis/stability protein PilW [Janthinobacterium agaricidamnosum]CDG84078.1 type IV pilus biogenesis/stability protein PilW [Janthinobacterium agaricidamnosum NBRC 102515 = DSM 9628]
MPGLVQRCALPLAALCLAGLLAGCAGGAGNGSGTAELLTSSDMTAGQKRAEIRRELAIGYYQQGQLEVALDEIKKALQADPDSAESYGVRALIYSDMNQLPLAQDNYQRALKLAPNNADLNNNYGAFLCHHGREKEALPYFDLALKNPATDASKGNVLNNAGSCRVNLKDYAGAEPYLLQALQLTPDLLETNFNLARVYYGRGDYQRAGSFMTRLSKIAKMESLTADVLWLGIKVQHKLGDTGAEAGLATQLRRRHAGSAEYAAYQRGAFDE